jgi:hypothetical protein
MNIVKQIADRVNAILRTGASKEKAARYINAEFHACAYVGKGKLWASFTGEDGKQRVQVFA